MSVSQFTDSLKLETVVYDYFSNLIFGAFQDMVMWLISHIYLKRMCVLHLFLSLHILFICFPLSSHGYQQVFFFKYKFQGCLLYEPILLVPSPVFLGFINQQHILNMLIFYGFPGGASGKGPACQCRRHNETQVQSLSWEDPLEEGKSTHSSIFSLEIPWTEESTGRGRTEGKTEGRTEAGYISCGCKELDMTEETSCTHILCR